MPELQFAIEAAAAVPYSATPLIALKLRIRNLPQAEAIHSLSLRCQLQIEPAKRRYDAREQEKLLDLFGTPERWARTLKPLLWMNTTLAVPGFRESTLVELQLPCTFDFNIAATKYFHGLKEHKQHSEAALASQLSVDDECMCMQALIANLQFMAEAVREG